MIGTAETLVKWLFNQDRTKMYDIKEYKQKRSLNQNSYLWSLINEIANRTNLSKEEVYLNMLQSYSQSMLVTVRADIDVNNFLKYYSEL